MFAWAAALFVGASVAMLFALQFYSAANVDQQDRDRVEEIVGNGIRTYADQASRKAVPQAYWDDAVVHLDHRTDHGWAAEFIGEYLRSTAGIDTVLVADRNNRTWFAFAGGREVGVQSLSKLVESAHPLLVDVRVAEAARGELPELPLPFGKRIQPIVKSEIVAIDGHLQLLSATLVQPDEAVAPLTARAPIIVTATSLNAQLADQISRQFLLDGATLTVGPVRARPGIAHVAIRGRDGRALAFLEWRATRPGSGLLRETLLAMVAFSLALGATVAAFVFRARRLARALVESEAEAARLAYRDPLTGLANRAQFDRAFEEIADLSPGGRFALLNIDLDHFKLVNDSFGHAAGDELICAVARLLGDCCAPGDRLIRFGGDEFVLLQARGTLVSAEALANRMAAALSDPIALRESRVFIGASIGIVLCDRSRPAAEWLRRADLALYDAKARLRGSCAVYEPTLDEGVRERHELLNRLHEAVQQDRLALAYQPQVDREGRVFGLEALARWIEPDLGAVPPAKFVELAEESGMIDSLGTFALRQAFIDSRRWPDVTVAVNVSALQLRQRDFADRVAALVREHAIDPGQFELEVTERVFVGEEPHVLQSLDRLRDLGFRIVLDDFGTGYSNLGALQLYPIDKIKIDKSFVDRIGTEPNAEALIIALVRLARALGLDVIAEGVETDAQRLCLTVAGCPDVQGFLTGRPMSADRAEALIARGAEADEASGAL